MKIDGSCHCGKIKYQAEVNPDDVGICHCTDCQALSGSAFRTILPVPEDSFEILSEPPKIYIKTGDSGRQREQAFCPDCGSAIYATSVGDGLKTYNIRVGTVRQRNDLPPKYHYWYRSAHSWLHDMDSLPKMDKQ